MRKLLNTLFVINEDAYLTLDGENLVVTRNKQETHRYALHTLEGIVCFTYAGASPALMGACARRGIDLCFFDPYGRFQARTVGEERGNVLLRQTQYRVSDDMAQSCRYARSFILGKVYNARWVLERATRDHPQRVPVEKLKRTSTQLAAALPLIQTSDDPEQLRGLEGEAAQRYFDCLNDLILQQKQDFVFEGRSRRPPLDNVNALLSFAYSMLARECASALTAVGLDPYVGFLHGTQYGKPALALDLMEEMRPILADSVVLTVINNRILKPDDFEEELGAYHLTDKGRSLFLEQWEARLETEIQHPTFAVKVTYRRGLEMQVRLMARWLLGEIPAYPPFVAR